MPGNHVNGSRAGGDSDRRRSRESGRIESVAAAIGYDADRLFEEFAGPLRRSVREPRETTLREARGRLAGDRQDHAAACLLATDDLRARRPERVLRRLESAVECSGAANRLAGYACLLLGRGATAKTFFERAIRVSPLQPDAWAALGQLQEAWERPEQAIAYYQRGFLFDDDRYACTLRLSELLSQRRRPGAAVAVLRESLRRDRRSARLNDELARRLRRIAWLLQSRGNWRRAETIWAQAAEAIRVALASEPTAERWVALGSIEQQRDRHEAAKEAYVQAVTLRPDHAVALTRLACAEIEEGDVREASERFRRVLEIDPDSGTAQFRQSRMRRFQPGRHTQLIVAGLEERLTQVSGVRRREIPLRFALAKILEDLGRYDEAWQQYDAANRLKPGHSERSDPTPRIERLRELTDSQIGWFDESFFRQRSGWGSTSSAPVFVVGMPRSGTTLVEQILSSHREVAGAGELPHVHRLRQQMVFDRLRETDSLGAGPASRRSDAAWISQVPEDRFRDAADAYLARLSEGREGARRVIDKMPTNFLHLGLIATWFPRATVIHCRRDPMDVIVSGYCQNLTAPFCDLRFAPEYYREYRRLMRHWEAVLPITICQVDYESLVADPEDQIRRLLDHCGLTWDASCLEFHRNDRPVRTPSKWQVRQPLYRSSVGKWRRFEHHLGSLRARIGEITAELDGPQATTGSGSAPRAAPETNLEGLPVPSRRQLTLNR